MAEGQISPWMPETDPALVAMLGKLAEEASELSARAARCIIHGLHEADPETGRTNLEELGREAADVQACVSMLERRRGLNPNLKRSIDKLKGYVEWQRLIAERANGGK